MTDTSFSSGTNANQVDAFGDVVIVESGTVNDVPVFHWVVPSISSSKGWWEIEEEIQEYRRSMLNTDPKYEVPGIPRHVKDHHRYYHLYKHRSF